MTQSQPQRCTWFYVGNSCEVTNLRCGFSLNTDQTLAPIVPSQSAALLEGEHCASRELQEQLARVQHEGALRKRRETYHRDQQGETRKGAKLATAELATTTAKLATTEAKLAR
mmetsp:Transcript_18331/g.40067  ORF Transcript_18331/g.40067 Transcript_18331/m.40067 type:complete len:113 (-) Transcript_18331:221-559(-)